MGRGGRALVLASGLPSRLRGGLGARWTQHQLLAMSASSGCRLLAVPRVNVAPLGVPLAGACGLWSGTDDCLEVNSAEYGSRGGDPAIVGVCFVVRRTDREVMAGSDPCENRGEGSSRYASGSALTGGSRHDTSRSPASDGQWHCFDGGDAAKDYPTCSPGNRSSYMQFLNTALGWIQDWA